MILKNQESVRIARARWSGTLSALLMVAAGTPLPALAAGKNDPFDYIREADRQKGLPAVGQRIVRLESRDGKYHYYRVNTGGMVRVYRQLSSGPCRQGEDWGYDQRGIWVDHGCRAEFAVGRVETRPVDDRPPGWAVGTFRGYDSERRADVNLTINPDGSVTHRTIYRGDRRTVTQGGSYKGGRLSFDGTALELDRSGDGIRTTERGGRRSRVTFNRVR